jgi:hypothetical protein
MKFSGIILASTMMHTVCANLGYATYHNYYKGQSLTTVACSDGENGLMTRFGYTTIDPMSPYVAATSNVVWNSDKCGVCYAVKSDYNGGTTVYVTAIDGSGGSPDPAALHFDLHPVAFEELLGKDGVAAGSSYVTYEEVDYHKCKGNLGGDSPPSPPNTSSPTPSPTPRPTSSSTTPPPTSSSSKNDKCCLPDETRMKAHNGCTEFYHCAHGVVYPGAVAPGPPGLLLFDEEIQNWNYANLVTCSSIDDPCTSNNGGTRRKNLRA